MKHKKVLYNFVEKNRELLKRVFPIVLLRKIKKIYTKKLDKIMLTTEIESLNMNAYEKGINLIGYIKAKIGLGQSCRLLANELKFCKYDYTIKKFDIEGISPSEDNSYNEKINDKLKYNINIIHINPPDTLNLFMKLGRDVWDKRYNIGFFAWETEEFPKEWIKYLAMYDEIWTLSEFSNNAIKKVTNLPVITIPCSVTVETKSEYNREYFNLPQDKFLFLIMYDSKSTIQRKNPIGAIEAFKKAFNPKNENVGIVIKINNCSSKDLKILNDLLREYKNVYYITSVLEKEEVNSLIQIVDAFISLHCAEGFGLILAEAMLLGTPTVATNYSGNVDFMNSKVACMVDYTFKTLEHNTPVYKKGTRWANPDINQAANYMKKLYKDKEFYDTIKINAKKHIETKLDIKKVVNLIEKRIEEIYNKK